MKKFAVLAVAGLAASSSLAQTIKAFGGNFRQGRAGEFLVQQQSGPSIGVTGLFSDALPGDATVNTSNGSSYNPQAEFFMTFCLELDRPLSFGIEYDAATDTAAKAGGSGAVNGRDEISAETAYLYNGFRRGTLVTSFDYFSSAANRAPDGEALQDAIWALENEIQVSSLSAKALAFYNEAVNAVSSGAWTGIGNVRALNLTIIDDKGLLVDVQDVLTIIIPLPTTSGLALLGIAGVAGFRRRR